MLRSNEKEYYKYKRPEDQDNGTAASSPEDQCNGTVAARPEGQGSEIAAHSRVHIPASPLVQPPLSCPMRAGMRLDEQEWWGSAFENGVEVQTGTQPANFVRVWRKNYHQGLEHQRTLQNAGMNGSNGSSSEVNFIP